MSKLAETLRALSSALEGLGVGWFLFGAQAAIFRGSRRLTNDIDVTLVLAGEPTQSVVARMRREKFSLRVADIDDFVDTTKVLPLSTIRPACQSMWFLVSRRSKSSFFRRANTSTSVRVW